MYFISGYGSNNSIAEFRNFTNMWETVERVIVYNYIRYPDTSAAYSFFIKTNGTKTRLFSIKPGGEIEFHV